MKKFVRILRGHEELLMNYYKAGKHSGIDEGLNLRIIPLGNFQSRNSPTNIPKT